VIGLSSFPWFANDNVPVSSETTMQIHLSNLSVIPSAARCLVPYLLIPCLDKGSIKPLPNGEISVLTKFFKNPTNSDDDGELSLYVMRINCNEKKFKDTSINGIPQFNSKWQTSNNDELIDVVIENSCSEFINE